MNLAVGAQRLIAGIGVDLAVDGDGEVVQLIGQRRKAIAQRREKIRDARGVDLDGVDAAGMPGQAARKMNRRHADQT